MLELALLLLVPLPPQGEVVTRPPSEDPSGDLVVELAEPTGEGKSLRWSPKGASVSLEAADGKLVGSFPLGPAGVAPLRVELRKSAGAEHYDRLAIDADRDGVFGDGEVLETTPSLRRDKVWSSFSTTLQVPAVAPDGKPVVQRYPVALWFVFDTYEPDAAPALRWSRRGWLQGSVKADDATVWVVLTESAMDGVYDAKDSWWIGTDLDEAFGSGDYRGVGAHAWNGEQAWRIVDLHPSGLRLTIRPYDPGMTRAEEAAANDRTAADRRAPRAEQPLAFGHDYAAALAAAKEAGKPVFLDFETTWCGPCKAMDANVYTAKAVVDAATAAGVVPVKLDGDVERVLVKQYAVKGYPTLILIGPDGKELKRAVGYQGVAAMTEFLGAAAPQPAGVSDVERGR